LERREMAIFRWRSILNTSWFVLFVLVTLFHCFARRLVGAHDNGLEDVESIVEMTNSDVEGRRYSTRTLLAMGGAVFCAGFAAFQQSILPRPLMWAAGRFYFWPTLPFSIMKNFPQHWAQIDDVVVIGGAPVALLGHPEALYRLGIRRVVNFCDEYPGPRGRWRELGVRHLHLPCVDHFEPTVEQMEAAVAFIAEGAGRGEKAYVHCKAGHGRSAAAVLAWLVWRHPDRDVDTLHRLLMAKRKVRKRLNKQPGVNEFYRRNMERQKQGKKGWEDLVPDSWDKVGAGKSGPTISGGPASQGSGTGGTKGAPAAPATVVSEEMESNGENSKSTTPTPLLQQ